MPDNTIPTLSHGFDWRSDGLDWPVTTDVGAGLKGVIAAETRVMWLDPSSGQLAYRGVDIETLAQDPDFERVAYLLITGQLPDADHDAWMDFLQILRSSRRLPRAVVELIRDLDPTTHPTRVLRAGVSALGCHEQSVEDDLAGDRHWREMRIVGQVAGLVEEIIRHRRGLPSIYPDEDSTIAEGIVRALGDRDGDPEATRTFDLLAVLYAAHGLDAPTFTSIIVASCLADPYYNVVSGLSALRGPRQGGASEAVVNQLLAVGDPSEASAWVQQRIADGDRIAGFGHPDYRMPDPRVVILRKAAASMSRRTGRVDLYEVARAVEGAATRELAPRGIHVNINHYGALLFHLLGAEPSLGPCLIAVARMAGLVALVRESLDHIRLYRPLSRYVGTPERSLAGDR
jgi:citrate synthase